MRRLAATMKRHFRGLATTLRRSFHTASLIITAALTAAAKKTVDFASDAEQALSLFNEVMGENAESSRQWSEQLSKDLGLNATQIRKYLSTFQLIIESQDISTEQALEMSKALTQLTVDLSSFRDETFEASFEKIKSGIVGMSRPLLDVGIDLKEMAVKEHALRKGIIATDREMTTAEKTLARFSLLLKRTEKDQGNWIKTETEFANSTRALGDAFRTAGESFGEGLLGPLGKGISDMKSFLLKNEDDFKSWGKSIGNVISGLITVYADLVDKIDRGTKEITEAILKGQQAIQNAATRRRVEKIGRERFPGMPTELDPTRVAALQNMFQRAVEFPIFGFRGRPSPVSPETTAERQIQNVTTQAAESVEQASKVMSDAAKRIKKQYDESGDAALNFGDETKTLIDRLNEFPEAIDQAEDGLTDLFSNAILEARKLSDVLRDLGRMLLEIGLRTGIGRIVGKSFRGIGLEGTLDQINKENEASVQHSGGVVGQAAARMTLPSVNTATVPRFHNGLDPNEFLTVLEAGERVTPAGSEPNVTLNMNSPNVPLQAEVTGVRQAMDNMVIDVFVRAKRRRDRRLAGV
jgi:hypothetical protein